MGRERYYNKAEWVVLVSNATVTVGVKNPFTAGLTTIPSLAAINFISTIKTFTDQRENKTVMTTEIDIAKYTIWAATNTTVMAKFGVNTPPNLLYVGDFRTETASKIRHGCLRALLHFARLSAVNGQRLLQGRRSMLDIKFKIKNLAGCVLSALTAAVVLAGPQSMLVQDADKNAAPKLNTRFFQQDTSYAGSITRGIIVAQTNQFSFVLPAGFRKQPARTDKKISLVSAGYTCAITAKFYETAIDGKFDIGTESIRQLLLSRHKNDNIVDEFSASVESMSGPAFEMEWNSDNGQKMTTRAAFVPYSGGHIEFSLQAPTSDIRTYDQALGHLLLTFRSSPVGTTLAVQEYLPEL